MPGMWILAWVVVGAIGGWLAGYISTRNMKFDWVDVVLGMVGAVVGGWLLSFAGIESEGLSAGSLLAALVGALLITWLYNKFGKKQIQ